LDFNISDSFGVLVNCMGRGNDGVDGVKIEALSSDDFGPF